MMIGNSCQSHQAFHDIIDKRTDMCGRFVRSSSIPEIAEEFDVGEIPFDLKPSYNVAPGQDIVIVLNDVVKKLVQCRWGFLPLWAKDHSFGYKMINARSETVANKSSFRNAFRNQRSLIVADGFYEWRKEGKAKFPVYVHLKSKKPFGFAGLYNVWKSPEGKETCTCTIITIAANDIVRPIHDRMPVIISKEKRDLWLDPDVRDTDFLLAILEPFSSDEMRAYDVSPTVNSPGHDSPDNIKPLKEA
jgi:putative SOS response-associated peptidase YedK